MAITKCNMPSYTCIQDDFIPLLVYPNDEKPAERKNVTLKYFSPGGIRTPL